MSFYVDSISIDVLTLRFVSGDVSFSYTGEASLAGYVKPKMGKAWDLKVSLTDEEFGELRTLIDKIYARHREDIIAQGSVIEVKP